MSYKPQTNAEILAGFCAEKLGVQLSENGRENVVALIETFATVTPDGVHVDELPVLDYVKDQLAASPSWSASSHPARLPKEVELNRTEAAKARIAASRSTDQRAENARKAAEPGNPWQPGPTFNRTRQAIVANSDPALAKRLRSEVTP